MFEIKDMPKCLAGWELAGLNPLLALRTETFNTEQIPLVEQVTINKDKSETPNPIFLNCNMQVTRVIP